MSDHDEAPRHAPPLMSFQQHIYAEQRRHHPQATGEFSWLLSGITLATKMIQAKIRQAGLTDILGSLGEENVQGEVQQKLDVFANAALLHSLGTRGNVAFLVSEEDAEPIVLGTQAAGARYAVIFDPLDGSSNIDVNVSVGTIFSIIRCQHDANEAQPLDAVLRPGTEQIAAGYVLYGTSTVLVYTAGHGVHMFTLDPQVGAYLLTREHIRMPKQGPYYSVNEAYCEQFPEVYNEYLHQLRVRKYGMRYIGSLVAGFHRTLLKGGVFLYPPTKKQATGKLRLLYEANPIAFLAEQAGGRASDGSRPVTSIQPTDLHQRVALVVGGPSEMDLFDECMRNRT